MGMIVKEELFDDRDIDPIEKITEGSILTCRVKCIQKANGSHSGTVAHQNPATNV